MCCPVSFHSANPQLFAYLCINTIICAQMNEIHRSLSALLIQLIPPFIHRRVTVAHWFPRNPSCSVSHFHRTHMILIEWEIRVAILHVSKNMLLKYQIAEVHWVSDHAHTQGNNVGREIEEKRSEWNHWHSVQQLKIGPFIWIQLNECLCVCIRHASHTKTNDNHYKKAKQLTCHQIHNSKHRPAMFFLR